MLKICPKCDHTFEYCVDDISKCHCISLTIDANTIALLKDEFDDCLCVVWFKLLAAETHNQL